MDMSGQPSQQQLPQQPTGTEPLPFLQLPDFLSELSHAQLGMPSLTVCISGLAVVVVRCALITFMLYCVFQCLYSNVLGLSVCTLTFEVHLQEHIGRRMFKVICGWLYQKANFVIVVREKNSIP
jgi:hypothetical protein